MSKPSESLGGLLYGRFGLGAVGDVHRHCQGRAADPFDVGDQRVEAVLAACHERDGGTKLGELAAGGGADTAARAGDEGDGAGQC
jgi:hypothetical protein